MSHFFRALWQHHEFCSVPGTLRQGWQVLGSHFHVVIHMVFLHSLVFLLVYCEPQCSPPLCHILRCRLSAFKWLAVAYLLFFICPQSVRAEISYWLLLLPRGGTLTGAQLQAREAQDVGVEKGAGLSESACQSAPTGSCLPCYLKLLSIAAYYSLVNR